PDDASVPLARPGPRHVHRGLRRPGLHQGSRDSVRPFTPMVLCAALLTACSRSGSDKELAIAVIPKGTTHEFWKSIHAGAIQAARELSAQGTPVRIVWKGPFREDDREQQVQVVEGFLSQGVRGIVLAALDNRALVRPV